MHHSAFDGRALKEYAILALSFLIDNREALIEDGRLFFAVKGLKNS